MDYTTISFLLLFLLIMMTELWIFILQGRIKKLEKPRELPLNYSKMAEKSAQATMQAMIDSIEMRNYEVAICRVPVVGGGTERQVQIYDTNTGKMIFFRPILNKRIVGALKVAKDYIDGRTEKSSA